jgi:uracil-DNA glycosylase
MIVGAYPTARFATIESIKDVPVGDVHYPFSDEVYFDGSRVRTVQSGQELAHYYLHPLSIQREVCWITNLVKVFLFKDGHIKKYEKLGYKKKLVDRSQFQQLAQKSIPYIYEEIKLASPKLIVLLGLETASVVTGESLNTVHSAMNTGEIIEISVGKKVYQAVAAPPPGILMREIKQSQQWKTVVEKNTLPQIQNFLR